MIAQKSILTCVDPAYVTSIQACRRGDLLAALCQEEVGDHGRLSREQLLAHEAMYEGTQAYVGMNPSSSL